MKTLLIGLLITIFSYPDAYIGNWKTNKDNTKIEIYQKDDALFGKIISSDNEKAKIGTNILQNFKYENEKWIGKVFAVKINKLVDAEMKIVNGKLEVAIDNGFFSKTIEWQKVDK